MAFPFTGWFHQGTSQGASEGRRKGSGLSRFAAALEARSQSAPATGAGRRGYPPGAQAIGGAAAEGAWRGGGEGDAHPSSSAREAIRRGGRGPVRRAGSNGRARAARCRAATHPPPSAAAAAARASPAAPLPARMRRLFPAAAGRRRRR